MTDLWSDDLIPPTLSGGEYDRQVMNDLRAGADVPLPKWLTDLRDGDVQQPSDHGVARQQRLAQMERDIAGCVDFVSDCDRYREAINHYPNPCVAVLVPQLMGRYLDDIRARALRKHEQLRSELAILRRQG